MSFNQHLLTQTLTVYKRTGLNMYGEPEFDTGTAIQCRWRDVNQLMLGANGEEFTSKAVIHPAEPIAVGDWVARDAGTIDDAHEVRFSTNTESLSGEPYYRIAI